MHAENLTNLDLYIQDHIGTITTRHASEERYACPPLPNAIEAERTMRTTLHKVFDKHVALQSELNGQEYPAASTTLDTIKKSYWDRARHADAAHGAIPTYDLDDYFQVSPNRSYSAIKSEALEHSSETSVVRSLYYALDRYQEELSLDCVSAAVAMTRLLAASLPAITMRAAELTGTGWPSVGASVAAMAEFAKSTTSEHIAMLQQRFKAGEDIRRLVNKSSIYPATHEQAACGDHKLRLPVDDIKGIARAYRIQERPYTDTELALSHRLIQSATLQKAVLLYHIELVNYADSYLAHHPERMNHSLEPFSEIFLSIGDEKLLVPNPKLIKVISNNIIPAVARIILTDKTLPEDLTGNQILAGIALAKKLRVFQTQIGRFTEYNKDDDTAVFSAVFPRTCPAMQMFSNSLAEHLPRIYDACRAMES